MKYLFTLKYSVGQNQVTADNTAQNDDFAITVFDDGSRHTVTVTAKRDITLADYREYSHEGIFAKGVQGAKDDLYFMNGYQSWTDTKEFYLTEKEHSLKHLPKFLVNAFAFDRYGDYLLYDYRKGYLHGYDLFYSKGKRQCFVASLNSKNAYLIFEIKRKTGALTLISAVGGKELTKGESFTLCDYLYFDSYQKGLAAFKSRYNNKSAKKIFGYTSWYNYYSDINQDILLRDLKSLDARFNLFQIDDGFETFVGDWPDVDKEKFPDGLSPIVKAAHEKGYMAGLWLAPLVAEEKSKLFNEHRDWFKVGDDGNPVKCGANWSGFYALDLENTQVKEYIKKCLTTYCNMGFDFFKLDFLYAANLPKYKGVTSSEQANKAYAFLRECLGDKLILGCGATVSNCCGVFDYLRVGPDVSLKFDDVLYMRAMHRERISTKTTLQNTVYRGFLNNLYFGNDPDVFLLRDDNIELSPEQKRALITLNALFGSVMMTSDNIGEYDQNKNELLSYALDLFNHATVTGFERDGDVIKIEYQLRDQTHSIKYHTGKGVLV